MAALRQVSTAELLEDLEAILLELRRRLDERLARSGDDIVVADELHSLSGLVEASTAAAEHHAQEVRLAIEAIYERTNTPRG
jgi:hypothetical protein